jgi:hypothetical protein
MLDLQRLQARSRPRTKAEHAASERERRRCRAYWTLVLVSAPDPRKRGLGTNASKADIQLGARPMDLRQPWPSCLLVRYLLTRRFPW